MRGFIYLLTFFGKKYCAERIALKAYQAVKNPYTIFTENYDLQEGG
jgi:hypothetical protein